MAKQKKGISPIIATVLIVAITVAAGLLLFATIQPLIRESIAKSDCTKVTFELDKLSSCVERLGGGGNDVYISIDRTMSGVDEPAIIKWIAIVDSGKGEARSLEGSSDNGNTLWADIEPGDVSTPKLWVVREIMSEINKNASCSSASCDPVKNIILYPVIEATHGEEACPAAQREIRELEVEVYANDGCQ